MNHYIETAYITSSVVAILMSLPQVRQLLVEKASDELNIGTWATWLLSQFVVLLYVSSKGEKVMIATNIVWCTFYLAMIVLILYYRRYPGGMKVTRRPELLLEDTVTSDA